MRRILTVIESPYAPGAPPAGMSANLWARAQIKLNLDYLWIACRDSLARNEAPWASHGFYPMFLNDMDRRERRIGNEECGYAWASIAARRAFYVDHGMSRGCVQAVGHARELGQDLVWRAFWNGFDQPAVEFRLSEVDGLFFVDLPTGQTVSGNTYPHVLESARRLHLATSQPILPTNVLDYISEAVSPDFSDEDPTE